MLCAVALRRAAPALVPQDGCGLLSALVRQIIGKSNGTGEQLPASCRAVLWQWIGSGQDQVYLGEHVFEGFNACAVGFALHVTHLWAR